MNPPPLPSDPAQIENVRVGQKLVLYAILLNFALIPLRFGIGDAGALFMALVSLVVFVFSVVGFIRLARGLGVGIVLTVFLCILMLVPLINLLILILMNAKATTLLRAAGYRVGLLGADKQA